MLERHGTGASATVFHRTLTREEALSARATDQSHGDLDLIQDAAVESGQNGAYSSDFV